MIRGAHTAFLNDNSSSLEVTLHLQGRGPHLLRHLPHGLLLLLAGDSVQQAAAARPVHHAVGGHLWENIIYWV